MGMQRNMWALAITGFINRMGSMVLFFSSLYLTRSLHFGMEQAGLIMSFYGLGSITGSYMGGWLADRFRNKSIMLLSLSTCAVVLLSMLFVTSAWGISAVMFLYACTADIFRPSNSSAIAEYSTPENRTRSVSLVRLAINLGFSLGPALGGLIAVWLGYSWLFVIDAATSVLAALLLYVMLDDTRAQPKHPKKTEEYKSARSAYRDRYYLFFILLTSVYALCFFQFFASIPQYFARDCNYSEDLIGLLLGLNGFLVVCIELPLVSVLEKHTHKRRYITWGAAFFPLSLLILLLLPVSFFAALLYTFVISLSEILAMPFMMNESLSRGARERQGQYSALYSIAYGVANILAPMLGLGIAGSYGFHAMFWMFILAGTSCTLGFYFLFRHSSSFPAA